VATEEARYSEKIPSSEVIRSITQTVTETGRLYCAEKEYISANRYDGVYGYLSDYLRKLKYEDLSTQEKAESNLIGLCFTWDGNRSLYLIQSIEEHSINPLSNAISITMSCKLVAETIISSYETVYSKGEVSYGAVVAEKDALPENGTLVSGSPYGSYCVIEINGTCYYYEKV
jgi:hypothetical protein